MAKVNDPLTRMIVNDVHLFVYLRLRLEFRLYWLISAIITRIMAFRLTDRVCKKCTAKLVKPGE